VKTAAVVVGGVLLCVLLPSASAAPGTPAQSVTLTVVRTFDQPTRSHRLRFSGAISSGQAGEDVTVMQQTCGYSFATAVAGAQTRAGGVWDAEPNPGLISPSATYRARWRDEQSEPVTIRPEIPVFFVGPFPKRGQYFARVTIGNVQQNLRGRPVILQRRRSGKWATLKRVRLTFDTAGFQLSFIAKFRIPQRGWTLRVLVPAKTAAPCFKPNVSDKLVTR
jgi:hypothetical protein